jgi:sigma-E factor negative regulatory protein RseC
VLLIALRILSEEGLAALTALLALIPYYGALYLLRDRIRQKIAFSIE